MSGDKLPPEEPSGLTGFYVCDHGENSAWAKQGVRYEVRFSFEGEILFADMATARLAAKEYAKILRESDPEHEQREGAVWLLKQFAQNPHPVDPDGPCSCYQCQAVACLAGDNLRW